MIAFCFFGVSCVTHFLVAYKKFFTEFFFYCLHLVFKSHTLNLRLKTRGSSDVNENFAMTFSLFHKSSLLLKHLKSYFLTDPKVLKAQNVIIRDL